MNERITTALHDASKHRVSMREKLLAEIHRKPSECGLDVDQHVAEATARLARPRPEKGDYSPPRPADWTTAYHVNASVQSTNPKGKRSKDCKRNDSLNKGMEGKRYRLYKRKKDYSK